jgi:hypothetical protein
MGSSIHATPHFTSTSSPYQAVCYVEATISLREAIMLATKRQYLLLDAAVSMGDVTAAGVFRTPIDQNTIPRPEVPRHEFHVQTNYVIVRSKHIRCKKNRVLFPCKHNLKCEPSYLGTSNTQQTVHIKSVLQCIIRHDTFHLQWYNNLPTVKLFKALLQLLESYDIEFDGLIINRNQGRY